MSADVMWSLADTDSLDNVIQFPQRMIAAPPAVEFQPFPKIPRWNREVIITATTTVTISETWTQE